MIKSKFFIDEDKAWKNKECKYTAEEIAYGGEIDARYTLRKGYQDNPNLCALPERPTNDIITSITSKELSGYETSEIFELSDAEKYERIVDLDSVLCPLGHQYDIIGTIHDCLVSSYKNRGIYITENPVESGGAPTGLLTLRRDGAPRAKCFLIVGPTGCGKSLTVGLTTTLYPKVIRHNLEERSYPQIPIIKVSALMGSMQSILRSIGTEIDIILDTGNYHESQIINKNIANGVNLVRNWIRQYAIGLIIIDEVQYMEFGSKNTSFENLVSLAEDTGVALGLVGNPDVLPKINDKKRILGRIMENQIIINPFESSTDMIFFDMALQTLWSYSWSANIPPLNNEIKELLKGESVCNIALLKVILAKLQSEAVRNPRALIDADYIKKLIDRRFAAMRDYLNSKEAKSTQEDACFAEKLKNVFTEIAAMSTDSKEKALTMAKFKAIEDENKERSKKILIQSAIKRLVDEKGYPESSVNKGLTKAIDLDPSLLDRPVECLVDAATIIINKNIAKGNILNKKRKAEEENNLEKFIAKREALHEFEEEVRKTIVSDATTIIAPANTEV